MRNSQSGVITRIRAYFQPYEKKEVRNAYLFLLPLLVMLALFILLPIIGTFIGSLFRYNMAGEASRFIGFQSFVRILKTKDFWQALGFTLSFTLATVVLESFFGLLFAILLNENFKGRGWLRAVILIPWAVPTIVSARTWKLMYDYSYGVINFVFKHLGLISDNVNWMASGQSAFWAMVISDVWKTTPFVVIILLAGLQAIPRDIYKQARIDGASMWKRFRAITLPLLKPVLLIAVIFRTIDAVRVFDLVYVLTGGGPGGSTRTLSFIGFQYYQNNLSYGRGMAISVLTFVISLLITLVYVKAGKFGETLK